MPYLHCNFVKI